MEATYNFDDTFQHKTLDKIYGEPDAVSLQKLFKQLNRNARSVTSTLGGGQYGHMFLVMTEAAWNALPGTTPVQEPQDPGPFILEGRERAAEIAVNEKAHEEVKRKYNKFQALKRILKNQLIAAIEPAYLDPIRCGLTDMILHPIADIITFLQDTYGKMTVNQVEECNTKIKNFAYDPSKSINLLLTAVQNHTDLLAIAGAPLNDKQVQDLAYYIINKYQIFKEALVAWNKIEEPKTWEMMKEHMRREYQMLKDVNALSISESALNTSDFIQELKFEQENLLNKAEKRFKTGLTEVMNLAISDIENGKDENGAHTEQMNNTTEINVLKQEIKKLQAQLQNRSNSNTIGTPRFNNNRPQQANQTFERQYYCWTHGAGHSGWNCRNPADGHQPEATFNNRMGGNNYGCWNSRPRRFNNSGTFSNRNKNRFNTNSTSTTQITDNTTK